MSQTAKVPKTEQLGWSSRFRCSEACLDSLHSACSDERNACSGQNSLNTARGERVVALPW